MALIDSIADALAENYNYRPLPVKVKSWAYMLYREVVEGCIQNPGPLMINGKLFAVNFERIVIGDYGAYYELSPSDIIVPLEIPENQKWRYDQDYLKEKELSIKYRWLEYEGHKVYHQVATVKYADYKPGYFYITVSAIDKGCP